MSRPRKNDDALVAVLARGKTHAEAGRITGVSARTISRRLEDPLFAARVHQACVEVTAAAEAKLEGLFSKAITTLDDLLDHTDGRVQLGAAQLVFKSRIALRELHEIEDRVRALEGEQDNPTFHVIGS